MYFIKSYIIQQNKISLLNFWNIFRYVTLLIPHFSYSACIANFLEIAWENNRCKICHTRDMKEACNGE